MRGGPREIDEPDCETDDPDRRMAEPTRADPGPARRPMIPAGADPICRTPDLLCRTLCRTPDPICRTDPALDRFAPRPDPTRRIAMADPLRRPLEMRADGFDNDERERSVAVGVAYLAFPRTAELRGDCDIAILDMDRAAAELRCKPLDPEPDPAPEPDPKPEPELVHDPEP